MPFYKPGGLGGSLEVRYKAKIVTFSKFLIYTYHGSVISKLVGLLLIASRSTILKNVQRDKLLQRKEFVP